MPKDTEGYITLEDCIPPATKAPPFSRNPVYLREDTAEELRALADELDIRAGVAVAALLAFYNRMTKED